MHALLICGTPRSGTTWLHNFLVGEAYAGKLSVDDEYTDMSNKDKYWTDEDYWLTKYGIRSKHGYFRGYYSKKFADRLTRYRTCFERNNKLLIESPYYCYIVDRFYDRFGDDLKVAFIRRAWQDVVNSMITHVHIKKRLQKPLPLSGDFFAVHHKGSRCVELSYGDPAVMKFAHAMYHRFNEYDKALLVYHLFVNGFKSCVSSIGAVSAVRDIYFPDLILAGNEERGEVAAFLGVNEDQMSALITSYKHKSYPYPALSQYGEEMLGLMKDD